MKKPEAPALLSLSAVITHAKLRSLVLRWQSDRVELRAAMEKFRGKLLDMAQNES